MNALRRIFAVAATAAALTLAGSGGWAAEKAKEPESRDWTFNGMFGKYDRGELQRGYLVYKEVCAACHGVEQIAFRNLVEIGFTEDEAKAIALEFSVEDGPDAEGEYYERPALLSDHMPEPYENENEARAFNNGAFPPDLSLIVRARHGGPDYLYALLAGYEDEPADVELAEGMSYNPFFTGGQIAMPPPLFEDAVEYADGTAATVEQMSHDVTAFLNWAAVPELEARTRLGFQVMIFLALLTVLFYFVKRKVWRDVH
jgi:cytochrome c1